MDEDKQLAQYERDYEQGQRAGRTDTILEIWDLIKDLPAAEQRLVIDKVIQPLRAKQS